MLYHGLRLAAVMLSSKPCSNVSGRKIRSCVPSGKISRELFWFSYSAIISLNRKRASRIIIPLRFWVVNAVFCRLQTSLGHVRRSGPRPYSTTISSFDAPVVEWEGWYNAGMEAGMRIAGRSTKGCFYTLPFGFFGVCGLGCFVSLPYREGCVLSFYFVF